MTLPPTRTPTGARTIPAGPALPVVRHPGAAVWIDACRAVVVTTTPTGGVEVAELRSEGRDAAARIGFLARVVDAIGDRARVLIVGPGSMRTALEREYTALSHRPDRLLDIEASGAIDREQLVARLAGLVA